MKFARKWLAKRRARYDIYVLQTEVEDDDLTPRPGISRNLSRALTARPKPRRRKTLGEHMQNMPLELLSEIFFWCVPTSDDQEYSSPRFALTLTHVCRRWREVALFHPRLWTYAKLEVIQGRLDPALKLMKLYLTRSRSRPVYLDIDFLDAWTADDPWPVLNLFEEVVNVARQFRPAKTIADSFLATHLEASSTLIRPQCEEWYFWSASPVLDGPENQPQANGSFDTGLRLANSQNTVLPAPEPTLRIRALHIAQSAFTLEPYRPWASSVTFLVIRDHNGYISLSPYDASVVLSSFPLLVHCALHVDTHFLDPPALQVCLNHLQSFSLSWDDGIDTGQFLELLYAPALQEIELSGLVPETHREQGWDHFLVFLRRSDPRLTHVILEGIDCFHISFLDCLNLMPHLQGLWLEKCILDDSIVRGLYIPPSGLVEPVGGRGRGVMTTLNTLVLLSCYWFSLDVLMEVLELSSADPVRDTPVRVGAYVDDCGTLSPDQLNKLQNLGLTSLEMEGPGVNV